MTAEIVVMNREAVAMAADSAVTVVTAQGQKIFITANKIFALSKFRPVGIMFYANASFMDVPWETVIKIYRERLGEASFPTLAEYGQHFVEFLRQSKDLFPAPSQAKYVEYKLTGFFEYLVRLFQQAAEDNLRKRGPLTEKEVSDILSGVIREERARWDGAVEIPSAPSDYESMLATQYGELVRKTRMATFEKSPLGEEDASSLDRLALLVLSKFRGGNPSPGYSGVVVAGFGEGEVFPCVRSFMLEGVAAGVLKWMEHTESAISLDNPAEIVPFAQSSDVATFMEGVDPSYQQAIEADLAEVLGRYQGLLREVIAGTGKLSTKETADLVAGVGRTCDDLLKNYSKRLETYRWETFVRPVLGAISMLPKPDLASLAESLVNLTSMKRKFSMDAETVGGPIDVAVISKGDGLIWTKRKHYFSPDLNPHFVTQYYRRRGQP